MIVLNFGHPMTEEQLAQVAELVGEAVTVVDVPNQILNEYGIIEQIEEKLETAGVTEEMIDDGVIINPPGLGVSAAVLMAVFYERFKTFPRVIRMVRDGDALPPKFVVKEVVEF